MPTYERTGGCCCGDCGDIVDSARTDDQILTISASTCDATCETGSWNQVVPFQFTGGTTFYFNLLPQFVSWFHTDPDPGHVDNCKYCQWTNGSNFIQQYFTGLQVVIGCIGPLGGDDAGKWRIQLDMYRRGDDLRGNCDESNDSATTQVAIIVTGISVDINGYLVGGPYTVTVPYKIWANFNQTSGDPSDIESLECTIDLTFGP